MIPMVKRKWRSAIIRPAAQNAMRKHIPTQLIQTIRIQILRRQNMSLHRDGIRITVEGSDYDKVKELTKDIEKTLDSKSEAK